VQASLEHFRAGRWRESEQICQRVLELDPANLDTLRLLGELAKHLGDSVLPDALIDRAIACRSADPILLNRIGIALHGFGRLEQAARCFRAALTVQAGFVDAYNNLGNTLQGLGQLQEAEQYLRQALELRPNGPDAHNSLGNLLLQLERHAEAEQCFRSALALNPDYADACNNLGIVLNQENRPAEAEQFLRKALTLRPDAVAAHSNLALTLERLGRYDEAEQSCRIALAIDPESALVHDNLGVLQQRTGRLVEAEQSFRKSLKLNPGYIEARAHWVHVSQMLCAWSDDLTKSIDILRRHVSAGGSGKIPPFNFLALPGTSAQEQHDCARQFANRSFIEFLSKPPMCGLGPRPNRKKLRIGYLSGEFREHAASYLLAGVFEQHNRHRFEITGYAYGRDDGSPVGRRIRKACDSLCDLNDLSDDAAARRIHDDGIDILVELSGYTEGSRTRIAALRPAPVQVSWIGYPGTLGHSRLADYLIGDPITTPLEHAAHYSESLALMPGCSQPNDRTRPVAKIPDRADAGLPANGFVFCSFNQSYKITSEMFNLWCRLLEAVPNSVLWLVRTSDAISDNLRREAAARGITSDRIVFAAHLPLDLHLGRLSLADLALDTYPYTSHTTASDALWAGVPLVTLLGSTRVSRVAASILRAAGMDDLITIDPEGYFRLASNLASTPAHLQQIRATLATNRLTCPLFDSTLFARNLERLYDQMWVNYRTGRRGHIAPA
jgi:protein O-GlcNAc transferase